jgi:Right handed beta helix region
MSLGIVVLITALTAGTGQAFSSSASEPDAECSVPAAIPGDDHDDRVAIQNALTSQGCAYLPAGRYDIDSIQVTPPARRPPMMLDSVNAELFGDGPGTVLAFRGSTGGLDWEGIHMGGVGSALHDLSITTGAISDTVEQTHAVKLTGPATDTEIARVSFNHPIRVGVKSGDCIQLVGFNDGREIARVQIRENDFVHCDRSGIAVHSGTTQLEIVDNRFADVGNTDLDFEGSGDTSDVLIQRNTLTMSPGPHGVGAIQLQLIDHARVTDNVLDGRGIDVFQSDDIEIDHNTITLRQATGLPVISVGKDSARTRILDNSITREPSAGAGAVISAGPHGSGTPDHLEIGGNTLVQQTSFHVVSSSGLVGLYVRRNAISYSGALADEMWGVRALGSAGTAGTPGIRTTDVRVEGNTFDGALRAALATSGANSGVGTVDTSGNVATGATFGIFCDNFASQGGVTGPITSTGDSWPAPRCGPAGFVNVLAGPGPNSPPVMGGGGGTPPGSDTTAPVLSGVSLSRTPFRVARAATAIAAGAGRGTMLRFSSSEAGVLSIRIERVRPGRRVATLTRAIKMGRGSVSLSGRIGAKPMKPGSYRLTLTARDAAGNRSKAVARAFTILAD